MVTKTKTFEVLDVEDVEKAVSDFLGRDVKIGEMDVTLVDLIPMGPIDEGQYDFCGLDCEVSGDGEKLKDEDYMSPLDQYMPQEEPYLNEEYIFNFSTDLFKSYSRYTDTSD